MNILELTGVTKSFGQRQVIFDLNLSLASGQHLVLTGPSGGGKTTLLRIMAGLELCETGSVILSGECVTQAGRILVPPHKRGIAMVFQDLGLWPNLSVRENVLLGLSGLGLPKSERIRRADQALEQCEIQQFARTKPARLSGGEQQRVALARALAVQPRLLLLDEPFSGIDLTLRRVLMSHLLQIARSGRTSIVWVSHNPLDAKSIGAEIAVVEEGKVIEAGTIEALCGQPQSRTMQAWDKELRAARA